MRRDFAEQTGAKSILARPTQAAVADNLKDIVLYLATVPVSERPTVVLCLCYRRCLRRCVCAVSDCFYAQVTPAVPQLRVIVPNLLAIFPLSRFSRAR